MKKIWIALCACRLLAYECAEEKSFWDYHPIHVGGNLIALGKANVERKRGQNDGELLFNKANVFAYCFLPVNECTFFLPRVEWNAFTMDWNRNPRFRETHFSYVQFALTLLTQALDAWKWIARVDYNIDLKHFSRPGQYGLFSGL
ncbi:MAG: hypothetical protein KGQ49_06670, partial [Verrucomicrobia bacterium]|nr:hypothetical protein [Verrucomicrobiota bacterium]